MEKPEEADSEHDEAPAKGEAAEGRRPKTKEADAESRPGR